MYGLSTPLSKTLSDPEFDSINSILAHSRLKAEFPSKATVTEGGELFYIELSTPVLLPLQSYCTCLGVHSKGSHEPPWEKHLYKSSSKTKNFNGTQTWNGKSCQKTNKLHFKNELIDVDTDTVIADSLTSSRVYCIHCSCLDDSTLQHNPDKSGSKYADYRSNTELTSKPLYWDRCSCVRGKTYGFDNQPHIGLVDGTRYSKQKPSLCDLCKSGMQICSKMNDEITEVYLSLNATNGIKKGTKRTTLCEKLLGIIPGPKLIGHDCLIKSNNWNISVQNGEKQNTNSVIVRGLGIESSALKCRKIKLGQVLLSIDDRDVTWDNIDQVLSELSAKSLNQQKVKLSLKSLPVHGACIPVIRKKTKLSGQVLTHLLNGNDDRDVDANNKDFCVFYLTLDGIESDANEKDVLYQYPRESSRMEDVRGLFITLCHTLREITDTNSNSSMLSMEGRLIHVCYHSEGSNLLVITAPADGLTELMLRTILSDVLDLLRVMFNSVEEACSNCSHHSSLDHIFNIVAHWLLQGESTRVNNNAEASARLSAVLSTMSSVQSIHIPEDIQERLSNNLSELEAADFAEMSEEYYGLRRSYTILGSCLFHKGKLLCNHLPAGDLRDTHLYLCYHGLLHLSTREPTRQVLIWREIFPTRRCHHVPRSHVFGYFEPEGRWFLLVVGVKSSLLCVLLEAGGCCVRLEGNPSPDPFYIDQVKATLIQIESLNVLHKCENRTSGMSLATLSADWFYSGKQNNLSPQMSRSALRSSLTRINNGPAGEKKSFVRSLSHGSVDPARPAASGLSQKTQRSVSLDSDDSNDSGGNIFKVGRKSRLFPGLYDMSGMMKQLSESNTSNHIVRLWSGGENVLFHYVHRDKVEGVLISSCPSSASSPLHTGPVQSQLTYNFLQACLTIRALFQTSKTVQKAMDSDNVPVFGVDAALDMIEEHGILFQYMPQQSSHTKKSPKPLSYWVVGRVFSRPSPKELYVCFHESTPQNLVELAFKLSFGTSLS